MGLLNFLLPPDPAKSWKADPGLALDVNLDTGVFAGVRFGDSCEALARFGPPENSHATEDGVYLHESRGFEVDATGGKIDCFLFRWDDRDPARRFPGRFLWKDRPLQLLGSTEEGQIRTAFGEPYWKDVDKDEHLYFYEHGSVEWQVEFVQGLLTVFTILTPPLLADPEERQAYRITRGWPPPL